MRLWSKSLSVPVDSSSSSPMVLMAKPGNSRCPSNPQFKSWRPCYNIAKGSCRFGETYKYVHDAQVKSGTNSRVNNVLGSASNSFDNTTNELKVKLLSQLGNIGLNCSPNVASNTPGVTNTHAVPHNSPVAYQAGPSTYPGPTQPGSAGSTVLSGQATTLPHAFNVVTLQDPVSGAWNMDTVTVILYPSPILDIFVRDNICTVEFDTFSFSVNDFLTRRALLRCDSTGDLYPVTSPYPIPHAFLVSQHTWHQRLRPLGGEVLRRLISYNFISCDNEKPLVLCHACQLGKQVMLPFVSSDTVITSCFDIIHSDCKYATEILERAGMVNCNSSMTSVDTESKLGDDGDPIWLLIRMQIGLVALLHREAEYRGVANVVAETCWLRNLLYCCSNIEDEEKHLSLLLHSSLRNPKGNIIGVPLWDDMARSFSKDTIISLRSLVIVVVSSLKVTHYRGNVSTVPKPRGLAATGQKKAPAKNKCTQSGGVLWKYSSLALEDQSLDHLETKLYD
ncbi:ribonuclease H-like domain-containing protein [Tanacetum coccineum]